MPFGETRRFAQIRKPPSLLSLSIFGVTGADNLLVHALRIWWGNSTPQNPSLWNPETYGAKRGSLAQRVILYVREVTMEKSASVVGLSVFALGETFLPYMYANSLSVSQYARDHPCLNIAETPNFANFFASTRIRRIKLCN